MNNSVIVTTFNAEEFQAAFNRKDVFNAERYHLVRLIAPRTGPGTNTYLVVPLPIQDPVDTGFTGPGFARFRYVVWNAEQLPGNVKNPAHRYMILDEEEFWLSATSLDLMLDSFAREEFYDVMEFPSPEEFHDQLKRKLYR